MRFQIKTLLLIARMRIHIEGSHLVAHHIIFIHMCVSVSVFRICRQGGAKT